MVDDHPIRAQGLVELIRTWGHEARLASSFQSALELSLDETWDLGLVDLGMRSSSAWELPERLRREAARPPILIAVGGPGPERSPARAAAAGFDRCLSKPVRLDTLRHLLEDA